MKNDYNIQASHWTVSIWTLVFWTEHLSTVDPERQIKKRMHESVNYLSTVDPEG